MAYYPGRKHHFIIIAALIIMSTNQAFSASYRLFENYLLDVGNRWEYQMHVTYWPDVGDVDWWGTSSREVLLYESMEGYDTVRTYSLSSVPQLGDSWATSNDFLTNEYLVNVREENADEIYIVRNNDPIEEMPFLVNDTDDGRHFGHGLHTGILKNPYYEWNGYRDTFITFLRIETITVLAGNFNCVVVELREEFYEFAGIWGYSENTIWFHPALGDVRIDEYIWMWNPSEGVSIECEGSSELTWTNVSYKQDYDLDFDVDFEDLSIFLSAWLTGLGEPEYNPDCDLHPDDFIDGLDFAVFAERWLAGF